MDKELAPNSVGKNVQNPFSSSKYETTSFRGHESYARAYHFPEVDEAWVIGHTGITVSVTMLYPAILVTTNGDAGFVHKSI